MKWLGSIIIMSMSICINFIRAIFLKSFLLHDLGLILHQKLDSLEFPWTCWRIFRIVTVFLWQTFHLQTWNLRCEAPIFCLRPKLAEIHRKVSNFKTLLWAHSAPHFEQISIQSFFSHLRDRLQVVSEFWSTEKSSICSIHFSSIIFSSTGTEPNCADPENLEAVGTFNRNEYWLAYFWF